MSSSARAALEPSSERIAAAQQESSLPATESLQATAFPYCEVAVPAGSQAYQKTGTAQAGTGELASGAGEREAQARALGRQQGELESRTKFEEQLSRERSSLATALTDFARDRGIFYQKVEEEVVRLALSIARKILHREAQADPLLLMGVVRVALDRIEGATGVVLAVHAQQAADWQRYLASRMDPAAMPEIVEDPALAPGQCQLRTAMGTADLGLEIQLKEIEQGLTDLLAARPQEKA
jgi:flagellar assembly protein FliH